MAELGTQRRPWTVVGMVRFPTPVLLLLLRCIVAEDVEPQRTLSASLLAIEQRPAVRREVPAEQDEALGLKKPRAGVALAEGMLLELDAREELGGTSAKAEVEMVQSWKTVYALVVMVLVAISPIAFREGLRPFVTVVVYLACLSLVKMWVKETMNAGLQFPDSITAAHMLCTSLAAACFERPKLKEALLVLPISVNGASLLTNNTALLHGGVAFVSMVSSCSPMFTFMLELCRRRRTLDFLTAFSVVLVCCGSAFCVRGEKTASFLALLFASMAAMLRSMKSVWQHELLTISVSPMRLVFWSGFWSFWITLAMVAMNEGTQALQHFSGASAQAKSAFFCSIGAAVVLNITQCFAVEQLGALLQSIVGNLNLILVIALSQAWLQEQVSMWQYVGVLLLAFGTFTNKYGDLQRRSQSARPEQAKLVEKHSEAQARDAAATAEQVPEDAASETSYGATDDSSTGGSEGPRNQQMASA